MNESFTVERTDVKSLLSNYKLTIPPFQRRFVWNDEKKRELIDSLNLSFPIGAITLYLNKADNSYLIVDGLQRINTIKAYLSNPCSIVPFKQYYEKIRGELEAFASERKLNVTAVKKSVRIWYESIDTPLDAADFKHKDFAHLQKCIEKNKLNAISGNLGLFQELRNILLSPIDIEGENVGLITYKGSLDSLPELFSKINQKNISLTGYEILHSLWYGYEIPKSQPGFKAYIDAFVQLANKNEGFVKLDDSYFASFNMYMNISSLEEMIESKTDSSIREFFGAKGGFQVFKSETVFDIFSTICMKTTNKINKSVEDIFKDKDNVPYDYILSLNEAIVDVAIFLNSYLFNHSIVAYSKYFYIYFFYYVFSKWYSFDASEKYCSRKSNAVLDQNQLLEEIKNAQANKWFRDENRQLAFFADKIRKMSI